MQLPVCDCRFYFGFQKKEYQLDADSPVLVGRGPDLQIDSTSVSRSLRLFIKGTGILVPVVSRDRLTN
jgi:hypothetical protein